MARDSCSELTPCSSSRSCSGVMPRLRLSSIARSTRSRSTNPSSTNTSVRKRPPPPRFRGAVTPEFACSEASSLEAGSEEPTARRCGVSLMATASALKSRPHHFDRRRLAGKALKAERALTEQQLEAVDDLDRACAGGLHEGSLSFRVDEINQTPVP